MLIESRKEWWRKELEEVAEEAEARGFARGQLAEVEANAVSDITIAKEKVEQIREEALDGRKEEMDKAYEAGRWSALEEVVEWCTKECDKQEAIIQRDMSSEHSHIFHSGSASAFASVITRLTELHHD